MDNLQYFKKTRARSARSYGFKPYYKWIIFNICCRKDTAPFKTGFKPYYKWIIFNISLYFTVLFKSCGFKPYYKWIIFNILSSKKNIDFMLV